MNINKKSILDEEKKKGIVYFCPRCRMIARHSYQFNTDKENLYKCFHQDCKQPMFKQETFFDERKNHKKYHTLDKQLTAKEIRKKVIGKLYNKGFSSRDIHELTHFSRTTIQNIIKKNTYIKKMSKQEFFRDVLPFDISEYTFVNFGEAIVKLLEFGFSQRDIRKLFKITYSDFNVMIKSREINYAEKHRVKLLEDDMIQYSPFL